MFCARGEEALGEAVAAVSGPGQRPRRSSPTSPRAEGAVGSGRRCRSGVRRARHRRQQRRRLRRADDRRVSTSRSRRSARAGISFLRSHVSRAALPLLRERGGGVIALIASIWGREGGGSPSYNVAKAAEISLAKAMASDLAKDGIRVLSVAPGSTLFPGGSWERRVRDDPEGMAAFVERELPVGPVRHGRRGRRRRRVPRLPAGVVGRRHVRRRRRRPVPLVLTLTTRVVQHKRPSARTVAAGRTKCAPGRRLPWTHGGRRPDRGHVRRAVARARGGDAVAARRALVRDARARSAPEEPCGVRTPFQRDRDRLVHSKPFRRLKGKTQVFIDPEGDHYRTRMTHTLETTAISRVVARALRLNEDLVEAIGLGHDTGHTPFGHAGEQALDEALRERFGGHFRPQRAVVPHRAAAQPHPRGLRRDPHAHGRAGARDARGAGSSASSTASPTSTTTSTTRSDTGSSPSATFPSDEIELLGATGSERIDTLVHDLVEASEAAGDVVQGDEVGEAMLSLRSFMFERVYLGPQVMPEHERARRVVRAIFDALVGEPERLAAGRRGARDARHRLPRGHDRPLRARVRRRPRCRVGSRPWRASRTRASRRSRPRRTSSTSSPRGRPSGERRAARFTGRCPFHEERTPSFSVDPVDKLYYCFGCGKGGDVVRFVQETENLDFVERDRVARRPVPGHARVRGDLAAGRTPRDGAASG